MTSSSAFGIRWLTVESNRSVEDLSRRTETDQVFANPDGTRTVRSYADPKRLQNQDGTWSDIDLTLQPVDGGYAPTAAPVDSVFSDGGDKTFVELQGVEGSLSSFLCKWGRFSGYRCRLIRSG